MSDQTSAEEPQPEQLPPAEISAAETSAEVPPVPDPPHHALHLRLVELCLAILLFTFVGFWPVRELLFRQIKPPANPRSARIAFEPDPALAVRIGATNGIVCLWFFAVGASVGSFLNVVLYRLPLGRSLVVDNSGCPQCGHAIRPTDNVPVIGWWRLGGRCRDCRLPIPFRYPLVEILFGCLYLGLMLLELHFGAPNLPGPREEWRAFPETLLELRPMATFVFHLLLLHWLFLALLFAWDGNRLPRGLRGFALALGIAIPFFLPGVVPIDWRGALQSVPFAPTFLQVAETALAGAAIGGLLAIRWWFGRTSVSSLTVGEVVVLVSIYLGWQVALVTASIATLADLLLPAIPRAEADDTRDSSDFTLLAITITASLVLFTFWRTLFAFAWFPSALPTFSAALLIALNLLPRRRRPPATPEVDSLSADDALSSI